jgi:hypothetical protein
MFDLVQVQWAGPAVDFSTKILQSWHGRTLILQMAQLCTQDKAQKALCGFCFSSFQKRGKTNAVVTFFGLVQLLQKSI